MLPLARTSSPPLRNRVEVPSMLATELSAAAVDRSVMSPPDVTLTSPPPRLASFQPYWVYSVRSTPHCVGVDPFPCRICHVVMLGPALLFGGPFGTMPPTMLPPALTMTSPPALGKLNTLLLNVTGAFGAPGNPAV